jgi:hypothetical protein
MVGIVNRNGKRLASHAEVKVRALDVHALEADASDRTIATITGGKVLDLTW